MSTRTRAHSAEVLAEAVATSGDYFQGFRFGGRRYHHLLDPATGEPWRTDGKSLTVVAPRCLDADAAATALFGISAASVTRLDVANSSNVRDVGERNPIRRAHDRELPYLQSGG